MNDLVPTVGFHLLQLPDAKGGLNPFIREACRVVEGLMESALQGRAARAVQKKRPN